MDRRRVLPGLVVAAALAALFAEPAAAQSGSSVTERLIWDLNQNLLYVAVPVTVLVEGILLYTVLTFRENDDPEPTKENRRLEITWTLATAAILLIVGVASYQVMADPYVVGTQTLDVEEDPVEVTVVAQRYSWTFIYNETAAAGERVRTGGTLVLPTDRPIQLRLTSRDWIHSFHVPDLGLKQDTLPGTYTYINTRLTETGTDQVYCAEYCGIGHSSMLAEVRAVEPDQYRSWLENETDG